MPRKNPLQIKRINKRKKALPMGRLHKIKKFLHAYSLRRRLGILTFILMGTMVAHAVQNADLFRASILQNLPPFEGTVYPVQEMPDWSKVNLQNNPSYSQNRQFMLPISPYKSNAMAPIYAVEHLASYEHGTEQGSGSHAGFDIRGLRGTPIYSSTNGVITKVHEGDGGFGKHVVVKFQGPDPDNPAKMSVLHFSYSHLDKIASGLKVGDVVKKGQLIGFMGDTGTAVGIHLHFQGDKESAPFSPYWPFTSAEAAEQELGFFEAVNAGLGKENAQLHTFHPMEYVVAHLSGSGSLPFDESQLEDEDEVREDVLQISADSLDDGSTRPVENLEIQLSSPERSTSINSEIQVIASISSEVLNRMSGEDVIHLKLIGVGRLSKDGLKKSDFVNGQASFTVMSDVEGMSTIESGQAVLQLNFTQQTGVVTKLNIQTDGNLEQGQPEVIRISAIGPEGEVLPSVQFPDVVTLKTVEGEAEFKSSQITSNDFNGGQMELQITPLSEGKLVIKAEGESIQGESEATYVTRANFFSDVPVTHPNYNAIKTLKDAEIVKGYDNNTFGPDKQVQRVEALQMLNNAFAIPVNDNQALEFSDIQEGAWYMGALKAAVSEGIVEGYPDKTVRPGNPVNTVEFLKMLLKTNHIDSSSVVFDGSPYDDVPADVWFTWVAEVTKQRNLLPTENNQLKPDQYITRGNVAEAIYRMKQILENNSLRYQN